MRALLAALLVGGCAIGAPPGFSPGDTWTMPLVEPLHGGRLLVPVMVHGKGPYLFALDRDALTATAGAFVPDNQHIWSVVDPEVANDAGVQVLGQTRVDDYGDTTHPAFVIELTDVEVGTLTRSLVRVAVEPKPHMFDEDGRRIYGVLGRDLIADSLVFGFDRDKGIAWLQTQQAFKPPAGASVLTLSDVAENGAKVIWQPVVENTKLGGAVVDMHPDFSTVVSQLVTDRWGPARLAAAPSNLTLVDSAGVTRKAGPLAAGDITAGGVPSHVTFAAYNDARHPLYHLDGTLGLDFFRPFDVAADWHHGKIYLTPRADTPQTRALRFSRWGPLVPSCGDGGCVKLELATSSDGPVLAVRPAGPPAHDLEVVVAATSKSGAVLPTLELNLPAGTGGFDAHLDTRYEQAKLEVVDASPFPRMCATTQGCLMIESALPR
ncbi:MAG: hypothetical protein ACM31C_34850 [Acidobacteriota bacterium]